MTTRRTVAAAVALILVGVMGAAAVVAGTAPRRHAPMGCAHFAANEQPNSGLVLLVYRQIEVCHPMLVQQPEN